MSPGFFIAIAVNRWWLNSSLFGSLFSLQLNWTKPCQRWNSTNIQHPELFVSTTKGFDISLLAARMNTCSIRMLSTLLLHQSTVWAANMVQGSQTPPQVAAYFIEIILSQYITLLKLEVLAGWQLAIGPGLRGRQASVQRAASQQELCMFSWMFSDSLDLLKWRKCR